MPVVTWARWLRDAHCICSLVEEPAELKAQAEGELLAVPGDLDGLVLVEGVRQLLRLFEGQVEAPDPVHIEAVADRCAAFPGSLRPSPSCWPRS